MSQAGQLEVVALKAAIGPLFFFLLLCMCVYMFVSVASICMGECVSQDQRLTLNAFLNHFPPYCFKLFLFYVCDALTAYMYHLCD